MEIYDNKLDFRLYDGVIGGFASAMFIHALDNFEWNEETGKEFSAEEYQYLYTYDWKGCNVRTDALEKCVQIVSEFLDTAVTRAQKKIIEAMDKEDKVNFGYQLYIALLRKMPWMKNIDKQ